MIALCSLESFTTLQSFFKQSLGLSQNQVKKYLSKKQLMRPVKNKQEIEVPIGLLNSLMINPEYSGPEVKIINEDENFLVLSKPEKVHCHPLNYLDKNNVLSFLRGKLYTKYLKVNIRNYDRSLIYRLDFETSGVLVLANNESLYKKIRNKFHEQVKKKTYLCICEGKLKNNQELKQYFKKYGPKGQKQIVSDDHELDSQLGVMTINCLDYNSDTDLTLASVELKTGLRHQIRAGLAAKGHPILGDILYEGRKANRLFLHAYEYEIALGEQLRKYRDDNLELFKEFFDLNRFL